MKVKFREALSDACSAMFKFLKTQNGGYKEMADALDKAKAALAEPVRNCEVGSAEEQYARLESFCTRHFRYANDNPCAKCPIFKDDSLPCVYRFLQMPYEKGGAE